jgi:signal transduction histidine kinase
VDTARKADELWDAYLRELREERVPNALPAASAVVAVINTVFIGLDWWAYPDAFWANLPIRLALNFFCLTSWLGVPRVYPMLGQYLGITAIGAMLLTVTFETGGPSSEYYAGLILAFVALPVLGTVRAADAAVAVGAMLGVYLAFPLLRDGPFDQRIFVIHSLFLGGGALASVSACWLLDRSGFADFVRRAELREARDELAQLDKAKSRFTANIHHELRTPLTLMLAPLDGMLSGDFGEVTAIQAEYMRTMHVNGLGLLKMINNLLDLAKVESGQLEVRRTENGLGRMIGDVVAGARPLAEQKGIELVTPGLESGPLLFCDRDAVDKVVINLLGNALKFTPSGGRIEVSVVPQEDGGAHLTVIDSGVGLEPEEAERIFDRFAQVDNSATRQHEGTGIGLSLAKELVDAHGGRIWAESDGPGHGARMHVVLPRGEADAEDEEEVVRTADGETVALGRSLGAVQAEFNPDADGRGRLVEMERSVERWKHQSGGPSPSDVTPETEVVEGRAEVLIVEDNSDMRRLLRFVVGKEFNVRSARNGREGLEAVRERPPDVVLTDVMMPEMSGTELCRAIKSDPETQGIPVILITSKAEREMKIEGLEGGADDYVTKPFHPRELLARVRSFVRLHELQRDLAERNDALEEMNAALERALQELKEAEVQVLQSERLAAVGELAAGVAHEVNNPVNFALNAMRAAGAVVEVVATAAADFATLEAAEPDKLAGEFQRIVAARGSAVPEEAAAELRELVGIVIEGLDRTHRLVANLRDLAGSGQGGMQPIDIRQGFDSTVQLMGRQFERAGVRIEADMPEPLVVSADAGALNQVWLNLLKNSAEAMEGGSGTVRILGRADNGFAHIEIRDDGPGIPEEARNRLFEPFFTTKAAGRGTGLGLAICQRIISEHGGTIMLSSSPGEGALFTIRLRLAEGAESA